MEFLRSHNIFAISMTGIDMSLTEHLDTSLRDDEAFLGILEIEERDP